MPWSLVDGLPEQRPKRRAIKAPGWDQPAAKSHSASEGGGSCPDPPPFCFLRIRFGGYTGTMEFAAKAKRGLAGSLLTAAMLIGLVAGVGLAVASIVKSPTLEGVLGGVFGGFVLALVIMGAGAWGAISLATEKPRPEAPDGDEIAASLKDVLTEVEAIRLDTIEKINRRAMWRAPLLAAGGVAMIVAAQASDDPPDLIEMIALILVPGIGGYVWASLDLSSRYARLYKEKVLPRLAATFGALSYRTAVLPNLARLQAECIFRKFDASEADDEIFGTYRTLPVSIVELTLTEGSGDSKRTTFDGLLVTLDLPRDTGAVTAVVSDAGALGNFVDRQTGQHRERVRLEDPVFEKIYEVYGTDQVASRALLNPAFMERLLALGVLADFDRPQVLCDGRVLQIAMPKRMAKNLFEPPSFSKPAATRATLAQLKTDIACVLKAADAVIDLDHRFEAMAQR